jgi:hypothetical protein
VGEVVTEADPDWKEASLLRSTTGEVGGEKGGVAVAVTMEEGTLRNR